MAKYGVSHWHFLPKDFKCLAMRTPQSMEGEWRPWVRVFGHL